ncbi:MAG: nitrilase-related carbon-nitrogen hydrolase [Thermodesulfobacteriota bacterium]
MNPSAKEAPTLSGDSYVAIALQPRIYGCRDKKDLKKNLENQLKLLDISLPGGLLYGGGPVKLVALPEGAIQGFYDELSNMDQVSYCKELAIEIPGPETDLLAQKAKDYGVYIAAQAKVVEPDISTERFFNQGFIISPEGEIILKHTKNIISLVEGSTSPYDLWDKWSAKYGGGLESYYPVVRTDIGNLGLAICAETLFPETYRALALMGAEVIISITLAEPMIRMGIWESNNRTRAVDNICYLVCPNGGPYYPTPDEDVPFSLLGGNAMIVDYRGYPQSRAHYHNEAGIPGEINIKGLRQYRATSPHAAHIGQMRAGLWRQIYERWPDFPKNRYMERTYDHILERHVLLLESLERLFEKGIYTRPAG